MRTREEEVRATVSKEEAIRRISQLGGQYDPTNIAFDLYNQLLACESIAEATPVKERDPYDLPWNEEVVSGNGSINDSYKHTVNFVLTQDKLDAISQLKDCTYRTPPPTIAKLLEIVFVGHETKSGHWLYIAQHWAPRPIYRVITRLIKLQEVGFVTIRNSAAYFTFLIKNRKKRRSARISMMA